MDERYTSTWARQGSADLYTMSGGVQVMTGGFPMQITGSNDSNFSSGGYSVSSTTSYNDWSSPLTPMSQESSSPADHENYSPYSNTPIQNDYEPSLQYQVPPARYPVMKGAKSTPSTLGWTLPSDWVKLYKFVVKQDGKERFFDLLPGLQITLTTPQRVDLDQDPNPRKGVHRCMYPGGCKGKQDCFGRPADLDRHYQNVHADDDQKRKFCCDYPRCVRAHEPFTRKDHYRDHLKDFHKEDIGSAKGERSKTKSKDIWQMEQEKWLLERVIYTHYWRCSRCLDRITVSKSGWDCPHCKTTCESERIQARQRAAATTITPKSEMLDAIDDDTSYDPSFTYSNSATICSACNGRGYFDNGSGSWVDCACQPPLQSFYHY